MDGDRFDDVEYHIVEEPEPSRQRRPRRYRRWALAGAATLVVAGGLAAGASALTGSSPDKAKAAKQERALPRDPNSFLRNGHRGGCHHHFHDGSTTSSLSYSE